MLSNAGHVKEVDHGLVDVKLVQACHEPHIKLDIRSSNGILTAYYCVVSKLKYVDSSR